MAKFSGIIDPRPPAERRLWGTISVPGDKSITHRAILFNAVAEGTAVVKTKILGRDNLASVRVMQQLGVSIALKLPADILRIAEEERLSGASLSGDGECSITIEGAGFSGLRPSGDDLYCGNSGTTARLLCGILAGRPFPSRLTGDESLSRRPFQRVTEPLRRMGARIPGDQLPLEVGAEGELRGLDFESPRASAQVKSALLLAGLQTRSRVVVVEPFRTRDHTERLLRAMGCPLQESTTADGKWRVEMSGGPETRVLKSVDVRIPGDFSAAAFFLVAATIVKGSRLRIYGVGINPTRTHALNILRRMGAQIEILNHRREGGEEVGDLVVSSRALRGGMIDEADVAGAIDEIPIIAVAAALAEGSTEIRGAEELRVKESDRIHTTAEMLRSYGVRAEERSDGLLITGSPGLGEAGPEHVPPLDAAWRLSGDHRIGMCGAVLDYAMSGRFELAQHEMVETSFPSFCESFRMII